MRISIAASDKGEAVVMASASPLKAWAVAVNCSGLLFVPKALGTGALSLTMEDAVADGGRESWVSSMSPLRLLTVPSPQQSHTTSGKLMSATRMLSPISADTVLLTPWALSSPWRF